MDTKESEESWDLVIRPKTKWYQLDLGAVWDYRDLLMLFVRRDFVSVYKQTLLGPLWYLLQPALTTLTFTFIFSGIAKIGTNGLPPILFYLSGITLWTYFSDCLNRTSNTFISNSAIFGKVYFPRLVVPISVLVSNLIKLGIQMLLFLSVWAFYLFSGATFEPHYSMIIFVPILIFIMAGLGLGFGILISSLTTKYRDLTFLVGFGTQLMMYASPIIYPLSNIHNIKYRHIIMLNPVTSIIETFKYIFLGNGILSLFGLLYSFLFMVLLMLVAVIVFNKVEKSFMDTV